MIKLNTYFSSVVTRQFVILPLIATKKGNQPSKTLSLLVVMFLLPLLSLAQKISCYYTGRTIDESGEGVPSTTVIMLNPQDSTVVTYGIADAEGHFSIPCNRPNLIAKFRSIGYKTKYLQADSFELGDIIMEPSSAKLQEVTVVANDVVNYPDKTVFIPNSRQKNASQSTIDLLSQMAIPMIYVNPVAQEITTASGKGISIYVNGLPLEKGESTGLNMKDVKRVEYLDYPSDPRFQGAAHVINFIMQQYEYGGYVKAFGKENFIANSGQLQANVRFQFKKMRYDAMFMGYYHNSPHNGLDEYETFRLLQDDGTLETFNRTSISDASKRENQQYFASLRAIYESNNTTASSMVSGSIDRLPKNNSFGLVTYSKDAFPSSEYAQIGSNNSKFIKYSGNYQFRSNNHGSLTFNPVYSYSHTSRLTNYMETGQPDFMNKALDNTHEVYGRLDYFKKFGQVHSLRYFIRGDYETSRTHYSGTASSFEKQNTSLFGTGATYTYYKNNLYLLGGFGWDWYWVGLNDIKERFSNPWADFSLQYSFLRKNTISLDFHYSVWPPSANYRSENIVKANHLLYYTGNPNLVSDKSFDFGVNYRFVPGKKIAITAFATAWIKKDRYVYDYESV